MGTRTKAIGERLPGPGKLRLGDVVALPLGDETWGYIRQAQSADCEILDALSHPDFLSLDEIMGRKRLAWASFAEPWDHPTWIFLGNWPYENEEEAWHPPKYSHDFSDPPRFLIYERGNLVRTTDDPKAIEGLQFEKGLGSPGSLVVKIRELFEMEVDRATIEKFAPFTTGWTPPEDDSG